MIQISLHPLPLVYIYHRQWQNFYCSCFPATGNFADDAQTLEWNEMVLRVKFLLWEFFPTIKLSVSLRNLSVSSERLPNSYLCQQNIIGSYIWKGQR